MLNIKQKIHDWSNVRFFKSLDGTMFQYFAIVGNMSVIMHYIHTSKHLQLFLAEHFSTGFVDFIKCSIDFQYLLVWTALKSAKISFVVNLMICKLRLTEKQCRHTNQCKVCIKCAWKTTNAIIALPKPNPTSLSLGQSTPAVSQDPENLLNALQLNARSLHGHQVLPGPASSL